MKKAVKWMSGELYLPSPSLCRCIVLKSMRGKVIGHGANKWKNGKKYWGEHIAVRTNHTSHVEHHKESLPVDSGPSVSPELPFKAQQLKTAQCSSQLGLLLTKRLSKRGHQSSQTKIPHAFLCFIKTQLKHSKTYIMWVFAHICWALKPFKTQTSP